jgi:hypothetical protein
MAKELPDRALRHHAGHAVHRPPARHQRLALLRDGQRAAAHDPALLEQIRQPPPVPTTSIYSKHRRHRGLAVQPQPAPRHTENIEVHASHIGMGMNPMALYAIADRLRAGSEGTGSASTCAGRTPLVLQGAHSPKR